jgi:hypothetical protein
MFHIHKFCHGHNQKIFGEPSGVHLLMLCFWGLKEQSQVIRERPWVKEVLTDAKIEKKLIK